MASLLGDPGGRQVKTLVFFVVSAAAAALALVLAWQYPLAGVAGLLGLLLGLGMRWQSRRRAARVLRSGDVQLVLERWASSMDQVPHPETMGPLMMATALAAYGWLERARHVLRTARRGPAWEAAVEHRLFVEALLLTFEGQAEQAIDRASALERLPMPVAAPWLAARVRTLRRAVGALARAFSHSGRSGDRQLLLRAGEASPLVYWAMRYGAAILAVDAGDLGQAATLLHDAPAWPDESCFGDFHREIADELRRLLTGGESVPPAVEPSPVEPQLTDPPPSAGGGPDEEERS